MSLFDKNGAELKVGDLVIIQARVIQDNTEYNRNVNVVLETVEPPTQVEPFTVGERIVGVDSWTRLALSSRQVIKAMQIEPVPKTALVPPSTPVPEPQAPHVAVGDTAFRVVWPPLTVRAVDGYNATVLNNETDAEEVVPIGQLFKARLAARIEDDVARGNQDPVHVGDFVVLASGGPPMRVIKADTDELTCEWIVGESGLIERKPFPRTSVRKIAKQTA